MTHTSINLDSNESAKANTYYIQRRIEAMSTHTIQTWWQQYREAVRCSNLREELRLLLYGGSGNEEATVQKLIDVEKSIHPGQLESWYLDKVIYNLRRQFSAYW